MLPEEQVPAPTYFRAESAALAERRRRSFSRLNKLVVNEQFNYKRLLTKSQQSINSSRGRFQKPSWRGLWLVFRKQYLVERKPIG